MTLTFILDGHIISDKFEFRQDQTTETLLICYVEPQISHFANFTL